MAQITYADKATGDTFAATEATLIKTVVNANDTSTAAHIANATNPHGTTKAQVGLGNVDNTADTAKPVSTAQAAADATKQPILQAITSPITASTLTLSQANNFWLIDTTSNAVAITLPASPVDNDELEFKIVTLGAFNATITCNTGQLFNTAGGATALTMILLNEVVRLKFKAGIWIVANSNALSQLDARYGSLSAVASNTSSIATLNSATKKRFGKFSNKNIVAFGSKLPFENINSNGTQTEETSRFVYKAIGKISNITNLFFNFNAINTVTPSTFDDITVEAYVEYPSGTYNRITFNGGSNSVLVRKGFYVESDVWKFNIPANAVFWIRTKVLVTSGQVWLKNTAAYNGSALGGEGVANGNALTSAIANNTGYAYGCSAVLGISDTKNGAIIYKGDSISCGVGDSGTNYTGSLQGGLFFRTFGFNYPVLMTNIPGQGSVNYDKNTSINANFFDELFTCAQFSISNLAINDLPYFTLPQIQAYVISIWYTDKASGIGIYHTTCTPQTSSTDSWATLANQTINGFETKRTGFNDWLRDGAPLDITTKLPVAVGTASSTTIVRMGTINHPALGYIEVADTLETSRNSGKWKTNGTASFYTADGLHPTVNGYPLAIVPIVALEASGAFKV